MEVQQKIKNLNPNSFVIESAISDKNEYLYKGIANRAFQKKFQLAENVKVDNAFFENGLLNIDLLKFKPARTKVMRINIQSNN